ncbi:unnamed protein product [marine sediment metagenome]|uniref:Transglutaminase-like domain-containing protein n=1 Tax=marine sediment metagenome TaxID=412755 RepID=X0SDT3_9ZZZZ
MKKALLIISILLIIFLAGCNGFDLSSWVCPNDQEFIALLDSLNTPEKICKYMESFEWNVSIHTYSPYQTYLANLEGWNDTGDCDDFAAFAVYAANWNEIEVYRMMLWTKYIGFYGLPLILPHVMTVFVEDGSYTYANNYLYRPLFTKDFQDIADDYKARDPRIRGIISWKVYDYWNDKIEEE